MRRTRVGAFSGECGPIDVCCEVVVIDENADAGFSRYPCGEYVEAEMERTILGDIVIRDGVRYGKPSDAFAATRFDDDTQSAVAVVAVGSVGRDIKVPAVGARGVCDVRRGRFVEEVPQYRPAVGGHILSWFPGLYKSTDEPHRHGS